MDHLSSNPTFIAYVITSLALCLNLLVVWAASGAVRAKSGVAINAEDGAKYGAPVSPHDPPDVARVLRVHANAQASIFPFLLLGLIYVLAGGSSVTGSIIFAIFTLVRFAHSAVYLAGKQPWRTVTFATGLAATVALMGAIVVQLVKAH